MAKITVRHIAEMKQRGEKIPMITAYDYTTAVLADAAEIPIVLVGDSLGMVVLGHDSTIPVTMDDIIHHTKMVARGNKNSLIVADLPFMTYQVDPAEALRNAARLLQEEEPTPSSWKAGRTSPQPSGASYSATFR